MDSFQETRVFQSVSSSSSTTSLNGANGLHGICNLVTRYQRAATIDVASYLSARRDPRFFFSRVKHQRTPNEIAEYA